MIRSRGARLVAIVAAIAVADALWIALDAASAPDASFVQATCGIGLGSATSPEWCFFDLDPRTQSACESEHFPVPGLACPNPHHGTGVANFPARKQR